MRLFIVFILFLGLLGLGCVEPEEPVACTAEAKLCPDGSYVGRQPPDCEFDECPETEFCDASTPCDVGECYKFEDEDAPICYIGDPCERCPGMECTIAESYPMQVFCVDEEPEDEEPELPVEEFCGWSTNGSCSSDSGCTTGGCSGQVCQSINEEPVVTTCEYRECYDDEAYGLECGCVNGQCQWS